MQLIHIPRAIEPVKKQFKNTETNFNNYYNRETEDEAKETYLKLVASLIEIQPANFNVRKAIELEAFLFGIALSLIVISLIIAFQYSNL